ncbi:MAG: hypothetical protein WC505_01995 [Patescibacteria group bacterium]
MKKNLILLGLAAILLVPSAVYGQADPTEVKVFDSTDNYLGGCSLTDTSTWTLTKALEVTTIQLWYHWQAGETELPVTITKDGEAFASFTAIRAACDPYQASWCNADYATSMTFPAGTYTTTIPSASQCLKPGGTGTVRLYGAETAAAVNANTEPNLIATANTNANTNTAVLNTNTTNAAVNSIATTGSSEGDDEEESNVLVYVLVGIIAVLAGVVIVMFLKCPKKPEVQ